MHVRPAALSQVAGSKLSTSQFNAIRLVVHPFSEPENLLGIRLDLGVLGYDTHEAFATLSRYMSSDNSLFLKMMVGESAVPSAQIVTRMVMFSFTPLS